MRLKCWMSSVNNIVTGIRDGGSHMTTNDIYIYNKPRAGAYGVSCKVYIVAEAVNDLAR